MPDLMKRDAPLTLSEVTSRIKYLLESNFSRIRVTGEISSLALPRSGHAYFSLKDENALLNCVMFRAALTKSPFDLENGLEVVLSGRLTVYEPRGAYQLIVDKVEPVGAGALALAFEQLKSKLQAKGWFDQERKRPLPFIPLKIGIVTSPTGAAIKDILAQLEQRFPKVSVLIAPAIVQGEQAPGEIIRAIKRLEAQPDVEVIILARGGGSIEDLWAFNTEEVARGIVEAKVPVISAVGHETDFSIADFVADQRAPTPTAAAQIVVPDAQELWRRTENFKVRLTSVIKARLKFHSQRLDALSARLASPQWAIQAHSQRVDEMLFRLRSIMEKRLLQTRRALERIEQRLLENSPKLRLQALRLRLQKQEPRLAPAIALNLKTKRLTLSTLAARLSALNPLSTLGRGFGWISDEKGQAVLTIDQLALDAQVQIRLANGLIKARVETLETLPGVDPEDASET